MTPLWQCAALDSRVFDSFDSLWNSGIIAGPCNPMTAQRSIFTVGTEECHVYDEVDPTDRRFNLHQKASTHCSARQCGRFRIESRL